MNLKKLTEFVHSADPNIKLRFFSNDNVPKSIIQIAHNLGFEIIDTGDKDVDIKILNSLDELYDLKRPYNHIYLVTGDKDYIDKIKRVRTDLGCKFTIVIGNNSKKLARLYNNIMVEVLQFPLQKL